MSPTSRSKTKLHSNLSNLLLALILLAAAIALPASGSETGEGMEDIPLRNWPMPALYAPQPPDRQGAEKSTGPDVLDRVEALPSAPLTFVAIPPCRMIDTRDFGFPAGYGLPALSAAGTRDFIAAGRCGIPAGAQAISVNATVTNTAGAGFVSLHPTGVAFPSESTVNYTAAGQTVANAAIVPLASDGGFTFMAEGSGTDLVLDVNGYFIQWVAWTSVNGLTGAVTLAPGLDVSITPLGQTLTIAANSTSANTPRTLVRRDGSGSFSAGTATLGGNLALPYTSSASSGVITLGGNRFAHGFGGNSFFGIGAGNFTMTGGANTASGNFALYSNTTGYNNTASGYTALLSNTSGVQNTANGFAALYSNTAGVYNTASGSNALSSNTTGYSNTASGAFALNSNTTGVYNTANGTYALDSNTTGEQNTANGAFALYSNTTGYYNTASGDAALSSNTAGVHNTASGFAALASNTTGSSNIGLGFEAGHNLTTGDNNIDIGNSGAAAESGTIRIGTAGTHTRAFIAGINGVTTGVAAIPVLVDADGQLGTASSSLRYKFDIEEMGARTVDLMRLRPVTFRYREQGTSAPVQFGLIAEEVAEVYPELVTRGKDGEVETVMYQFLAPMLLNEVQKQRRTIEEQQRANADQQRTIERLERSLEEFRARFESLERRSVGTALADK